MEPRIVCGMGAGITVSIVTGCAQESWPHYGQEEDINACLQKASSGAHPNLIFSDYWGCYTSGARAGT